MVANPFGEPLVVAIESDVSGLTGGMQEAIASLGTLKMAVGGAGVALAGLAAGGLAASIKAASSFQTELVELEKVTNPETAAAMSDEIQRMAETIPLASSELAQIASDAGRFGVRGTENITSFTEAVSKMAVATDLSSSEAGESLAKLAQLTGTPISEVENLGSSINELSNNMATSSSEIVDSMLRSSAAMSQFGLSQTEIAGFSGALNAVSESSERAGTRLRRLMQELENPKKIDNIAMALGMTTEEFKAMKKNDPAGLLRSMAESMAEGGQTAENLNKALSTTSRQALSGLGQNLEGLDTALDMSAKAFEENTSLQKEFDAASQTLSNQIQLLKNSLNNVAIQIGSVLLPVLTRLVKRFSVLVDWFSQFNKSTNGVAGAVILLTSLFGGLIVAGGTLVSALGGMSAALVHVGAGFGALGSAIGILLGPIGLLIGIVAALGYAWSTNFAGIRDMTTRVSNAIQKGLKPIIGKLNLLKNRILKDFAAQWGKTSGGVEAAVARIVSAVGDQLVAGISIAVEIIKSLLDKAYLWWAEHGETVVSIVIRIINIVNNTLVAGIQTAFPIIKRAVAIATEAFRLLAQGVKQAIAIVWQNVLQPFINWFVPIWRETMGPVVEEAAKTWSVWSQIVTYTINTIRKNINAFLAWLEPYWNAYWKEFNANFKVFMSDMQAIWDLVGDDLIATAQFVWDLISSIIKGALIIISGILQTVMAVARADWATAWNIIKQTVVDVVSGIGEFVLKWGYRFVYRIGEIVLGVIDWFVQLGQELIWGSLIPDMLSDIKSAFSEFGRDVVRWISNFVGNFVRKIKNWASRVNTAFWNGLDRMYRALGRAGKQLIRRMGSIASDVVQEVKDVGSKMYNAGKNLIKSIVRGINKNPNAVKKAIADHAGKAAKFLPWSDAEEGPLSNLSESGPGLVRTIAEGIRAEGGRLSAAVREMAAGARAFLPRSDADTGPLSDLRAAGRSFGSTFAEGIRSSESEVTAAANSLAGAARGALGGAETRTMIQVEDGSWVDPSFFGWSTGDIPKNATTKTQVKTGGGWVDRQDMPGRQSPLQNQTPNISAQFDSLAQSNRQAIQRLEGEMAQRLDTLISHAKTSEGVVRIDGQKAGTIIEGSMHRKQYSTEIHE